MASEQTSNGSSSESDFDMDEYLRGGIAGYRFEPQYAPGEHRGHQDESSDSEGEREPLEVTGRLCSHDWCKCAQCDASTLAREKECICCVERLATRSHACPSSTDPTICVTHNMDFTLVCLTTVVLRNVLVSNNNVKVSGWEVNPPSNRGFRYAACRQFSWWIHGKMGPSRRRVIPSCAVHAIRKRFPKSPEEEAYQGFISDEEDSD